VLKPIPGSHTEPDNCLTHAAWRSHVTDKNLSKIESWKVLEDTANLVLDLADDKLQPRIWVSWSYREHIPRLLQMIMEAERLEHRYKDVQRFWDTKVEIPAHEFLDSADHHGCVLKLQRATAGLPPYANARKWTGTQVEFGATGPVTGLSAFEFKLLRQFLSTTLNRLNRNRNSDGRAVLEVRIHLPSHRSLWEIQNAWLYVWFRVFRSPTFQLKFTVLYREERYRYSPAEPKWEGEYRFDIENVVDPADRKDFVVELEGITEEEDMRLYQERRGKRRAR
jgi:hypothetical protein